MDFMDTISFIVYCLSIYTNYLIVITLRSLMPFRLLRFLLCTVAWSVLNVSPHWAFFMYWVLYMLCHKWRNKDGQYIHHYIKGFIKICNPQISSISMKFDIWHIFMYLLVVMIYAISRTIFLGKYTFTLIWRPYFVLYTMVLYID